MKRTHFVFVALALIVGIVPSSQAQGTLYFSNLERTPNGSASVANDSWIAQIFTTGMDQAGYTLDSIQLRTGLASGDPSGFSLSIYSSRDYTPDASLARLNGSAPLGEGIYSFASPDIQLSPDSYYFVVATAETSVAQGAFEWNTTRLLAPVPGWNIPNIGSYISTDGMGWDRLGRADVFQMGIYATAVPEPTTLCLWGLGLVGLMLSGIRRRR